MLFGEWARSVRKEQKLDIRTLAEQSGVDASTISRVENKRTQITLLSAIRLCDGLGVTVSDVLTQVYGKGKSDTVREKRTKRSTAPTTPDVEHFLDYFHQHEEQAKSWLADLLNTISLTAEQAEKTVTATLSRSFSPEDIHKLLVGSPMYQFELQYPSTITATDILTFYEQGAMLALTDIAQYSKRLRREKQVKIAHLEQEAKISQNMLSRLESPSIEQIKLEDVVMLDTLLEQEGVLLKMYWTVYSFYKERVRHSASMAEQEMKLSSIFLIACRWLQIINPQDTSWTTYVHSLEKLA